MNSGFSQSNTPLVKKKTVVLEINLDKHLSRFNAAVVGRDIWSGSEVISAQIAQQSPPTP